MTVHEIVNALLETAQTYHVNIGGEYWFEYRCWESDSSADAKLWYHSHQRCRVLKLVERGGGKDIKERGYNGHPAVYRVRFPDGYEADATEDELLLSQKEFNRPNPPVPPERRKDRGAKVLYGKGHKV